MQKSPGAVLQNLRHLHENPPSLYVSMSAEVENSLGVTSKVGSSSLITGGQPPDSHLSMDGIDKSTGILVLWNKPMRLETPLALMK